LLQVQPDLLSLNREHKRHRRVKSVVLQIFRSPKVLF
jgi:hypothetical protein